MKLTAELTQQRPPLVGEGGGQTGGGVERVRDLDELGRIEATATRGAFDPRSDVVRRTDTHARPLAEEVAGLVGLVEPASDDDRVAARLERLCETATWRERRVIGQPGANLGKLEQDERAGVHQGRSGGPETDGWSAMANRHGFAIH